MLKIVFLGTAGSTPTKYRSLSSVSLEYNGDILLFDCGEGAQRRMMQYSVNISRIRAVFLSHIHGDHTIGIAGLVRTLALNKRTEPLYIYIPKGHERQLRELLGFDKAIISYKIIVKPLASGGIYKGKNYRISAFRLLHNIPTYGFAFNEDEKRRFVKEKIAKLNIRGRMFQTLLKEGSIKLNGKTIKLKEISVKREGRRVVYVSDTRPTRETLKASLNADLLIHESTYANSEARFAKERYHSTSSEAAQIAKAAKVHKLILTHISSRYRDTDMLLKDAKKVFKNTEVAKDGMSITL